MALPANTEIMFGRDMASGKLSDAEVSVHFDDLMKAIDAAPSRVISREDMASGFGQASIDFNQTRPASAYDALSKAITPDMAKGMSAEALASVNSALDALKSQQPDLVKDLTLTSPLSSGLVAYDLEAPAKLLAPRPTPLRNRIPRVKGIGTSHSFKVVSGFTGSGTGGLGNVHPGIADSTQTNFAPQGAGNGLYYARGPKISYAGYDVTLPYSQFSLSDEVTWSAQYAGQGYQDIRQLSRTSLLYASMLMEERLILMGRGTKSGYRGALAAPTGVTVTFQSPTGSQVPLTGLTNGTDKLHVIVTSDAGAAGSYGFGESVGSTIASTTATFATGQNAVITLTDVPDALGYNVYVAVGPSAPAASAFHFYTHVPGLNSTGKIVVQGAAPTTGAIPPVADTSAALNSYDGILPTVMGPSSGYSAKINRPYSTTNPGSEYQDAFAALYQSVKADPDRILFNGADRKQLSDCLKAGTSNNYFMQVTQDQLTGVTLGSVAIAVINEITGKRVEMEVHPWLPQGVTPIISDTLPIPDTNVSNVWSMVNVQDYFGVDWPVMQFAYESSSYWFGTMMCQAPAWNGCVSGISAVGQP